MSIEEHPDFPCEPGSERVRFAYDEDGARPTWGRVAIATRPRTVPWRRVLRVSRVGADIDPSAVDAAASTLAEFARSQRALRLHAEVWQPDTETRLAILAALQRHGFEPVAVPRMYTHTVLIDLARSEDDLLASFSATCRRHIRAPGKAGLRTTLLVDDLFAPRLAALDAETMARTGGEVRAIDWPAMIRFTREQPTLAALIGITRRDSDAQDALLGYVLGVRHGPIVEYFRAASTRATDLRAPLLYAPAWELMRWARSQAATTFDFGGIAPAGRAERDGTGGIADFKHSFCPADTEVGGEMVLAPSVLLDRLARLGSRIASRMGSRT